jgi:hypothetical protein
VQEAFEQLLGFVGPENDAGQRRAQQPVAGGSQALGLPASSHLLRLPTRALGARPNLVLPGKDQRQGPFVAEAELLATADLAVEHEAIEERERTGPPP